MEREASGRDNGQPRIAGKVNRVTHGSVEDDLLAVGRPFRVAVCLACDTTFPVVSSASFSTNTSELL